MAVVSDFASVVVVLSWVILDEYYCFGVMSYREDVGHGHQVVACVEGADYPPCRC